MSQESREKILEIDLSELRKYSGCIAVVSLDTLKRLELFRELHRIARLAGKKLYLLIVGATEPVKWVELVRDHLAYNLDVSIQIYEIESHQKIESLLDKLCYENMILIVEREKSLLEIVEKTLTSSRCKTLFI
ncbi:MAG: hypothetical protein ABWJ42_03820 [Sulfolobales archaeon]